MAVRLAVEREREIEKFDTKTSFKVSAVFDLGKGKQLVADLPEKFDSEEEALKFLSRAKAQNSPLAICKRNRLKKLPAPPFTTSTLQQEAGRKLGFSVLQTMVVAQKLYEAGKISYMRTDSLNLSEEAVAGATKQINSAYGKRV